MFLHGWIEFSYLTLTLPMPMFSVSSSLAVFFAVLDGNPRSSISMLAVNVTKEKKLGLCKSYIIMIIWLSYWGWEKQKTLIL